MFYKTLKNKEESEIKQPTAQNTEVENRNGLKGKKQRLK
jgi:hypothetical protein